ncbi:MAG: hypothetical protein GY786_17950, partial [Proteobacteria bacterium]|nr:hypothetical protein [Pseudomonadota bacterium]
QLLSKKKDEGVVGLNSLLTLNFMGDEPLLDEIRTEVKKLFRSRSIGCPVHEEKLYAPLTYLAGAPFGYLKQAELADLNVKVLSDSACLIAPIYGNNPSFKNQNSREGLFYTTDESNPVFIDPRFLRAPAKHEIVLGNTGSGKSTYLNYNLEWIINQG